MRRGKLKADHSDEGKDDLKMCRLACLLTAHDLLRRFQASVCPKQHGTALCARAAGTAAPTAQAGKRGTVAALESAFLCIAWSADAYFVW